MSCRIHGDILSAGAVFRLKARKNNYLDWQISQSAVFNSTVIYYADPVLIDVFCNACRDRPYSKWNDAAVDDPAGHLRVIAGKLEDCAMGDRFHHPIGHDVVSFL